MNTVRFKLLRCVVLALVRRLVSLLYQCVRRDKVYHARVLSIGAQGSAYRGSELPPPGTRPARFPANQIQNHKYNVFTFLPLVRIDREQFTYYTYEVQAWFNKN